MNSSYNNYFENAFASVIVPVYNVERMVARCVDSLLNQTYLNYEIILVDDGSTDSSGKICDALSEKDSKVQVVHKANGGPSSARNEGIQVARGEYILFCDSDDTVERQWIELLVNAAQEHPNSLVICGYQSFDDSDNLICKVFHAGGIYKITEYYNIFSLTGSTWNKIFSLKIIKENGLYFDETITYAEDVFFILDYLAFVNDIFILENTLYNYYKYNAKDRKTLSSFPTYTQMKRLYDKRISFITESSINAYEDMYYGNLWKRFEDIVYDDHPGFLRQWSEARSILADAVFCEHLKTCGRDFLDLISRRLLIHGRVKLFYILQKCAKLKRTIFAKLLKKDNV